MIEKRKAGQSIEIKLETAVTNAASEFSKSHENLGISLKTMGIGLALVADENDRCTSIDSLWEVMKRKDLAWGTKPGWKDPLMNVNSARTLVANLGVAQGFSAFDKFIEDSSAEVSSVESYFSPSSRPSAVNPFKEDEIEGEMEKVQKFYERMGFDRSSVDFFWPVYEYYQLARNCIVHRRGVASKKLEAISNSEQLDGVKGAWQQKTGDFGPLRLPKLSAGAPIEFEYSDSILASNALRIIAQDISRKCISLLRVEGLVFLASRRVLSTMEKSETKTKHIKLATAVAHHLMGVNRVKSIHSREVEPLLKEIGILKDGDPRFQALRLQIAERS